MHLDPSRRSMLIGAIADVEATFAHEITQAKPGVRERRSPPILQAVCIPRESLELVSVRLKAVQPNPAIEESLAESRSRCREVLSTNGLQPNIINVLETWIAAQADVHFLQLQLAELREALDLDSRERKADGS